MDLNIVISAVAGLLTGGGISWIFRIRESKAQAGADVIDSSADAMTKMMKLIGDQQERFNKIIADKDNIIEQQRQLIDKYKSALDAANREIGELKWRIAENERKITGMQKVIDEYATTTKKLNENNNENK